MKEPEIPKQTYARGGDEAAEESDDDELLMQREITIKPMEFPGKTALSKNI